MPRKARIDAPDARHHIFARGIEKRNLFKDNSERQSFIERLGNVLKDTKTPGYAWANMPIHFHLLFIPLFIILFRIKETRHKRVYGCRKKRSNTRTFF